MYTYRLETTEDEDKVYFEGFITSSHYVTGQIPVIKYSVDKKDGRTSCWSSQCFPQDIEFAKVLTEVNSLVINQAYKLSKQIEAEVREKNEAC